MKKLNREIVEIALAESLRLCASDDFITSFKQVLDNVDIENDKQTVYSDAIWELYANNGSDKSIFLNDGQTKPNFKLLTQILLIDDICKHQSSKIETLEELKKLLNSQKIHRGILNEWSEGFLAVIYQEHCGGNTWIDYVLASKGDWDELHILDDSLPYCSVSLDAILYYLELAVIHHSNDMAIPLLGNNIALKISEEAMLKTEVEKNIDTIISRESARRFLPSFIRGIINDDKQKFLSCLEQYPQTYPQFCNEFLWALGAACPKEQDCISAYKQALDIKLNEGQISTSEYLNLSTRHLFKTADVITLATNFSNEASSTEDFNSLIGFLIAHIEDNKCNWFEAIATKIVQADDNKLLNHLDHLFYQLVKQNKELSYSLIAKRFESIGRKNFLENFWHELVKQSPELFHEQLTNWFNTESRNVHSALLKLTSLSEIPDHAFRLSKQVLLTMSSSEKLYVAMKIAGYMYSKEHLQTLIMSLMKSVKEKETNLLSNLYDIFHSYVIYNYRTTLDLIKEELKREDIPIHIVNFYEQLEKAYDTYFHNLSLIKIHPELSHNRLLSQHIQYYKQQQFSGGLKESKRGSFLDTLKNVQIHSNNWAIRRPSEKKHDVKPLGKFGVSIEFPSGEIYNPVLQESKRRFYQSVMKHEININ